MKNLGSYVVALLILIGAVVAVLMGGKFLVGLVMALLLGHLRIVAILAVMLVLAAAVAFKIKRR